MNVVRQQLVVSMAWVVCVFGFTTGCQLRSPQPGVEPAIQDEKDVSANYHQIRLRMRSLVDPLCGEIEQAADRIAASTTNRVVQRSALVWKIQAVPAMREALYQPNPLMALMDSWVLCNQMAAYFESGPGRSGMGEAASEAAMACREMEEEIARVAASLTFSGDVSTARAFAKEWADQHPIKDSITSRESTLTRVTEKELPVSFATSSVIAGVATTFDDLNRKLEIYSNQLFRQARWEAELFKTDLLAEMPVEEIGPLADRAIASAERAVVTVDRLAPALERTLESMERTLHLAEEVPDLVTRERKAVLKGVHDEVMRTKKFAQEERIATVEQVHEILAEERRKMTRDVEQIGRDLVDHTMWRVAQIAALLVAVLFLAALIGLYLIRRMIVLPLIGR